MTERIIFKDRNGYALIANEKGEVGVKTPEGKFVREKDVKQFLQTKEVQQAYINELGYVPRFKFKQVEE